MAALLILQQLIDQAAAPKDILLFIEKQWPQDVAAIVDQAASAYKLAREHMGNDELQGFDAQFPPSAGENSRNAQTFRLYALLGKALCGTQPKS